MSNYIWTTTPAAVRKAVVQLRDGVRAVQALQVYKYAYKPYRSVFAADDNDKMWVRKVKPCVRAFDNEGTRPLALATMGPPELGAPVFDFSGAVAIDDGADLKQVGTVVSLRKVIDVTDVDGLVAKHTAFKDLADMCDAKGNYTPTIRCLRATNVSATKGELRELRVIADAYDAAQAVRGDSRRAYRG